MQGKYHFQDCYEILPKKSFKDKLSLIPSIRYKTEVQFSPTFLTLFCHDSVLNSEDWKIITVLIKKARVIFSNSQIRQRFFHTSKSHKTIHSCFNLIISLFFMANRAGFVQIWYKNRTLPDPDGVPLFLNLKKRSGDI